MEMERAIKKAATDYIHLKIEIAEKKYSDGWGEFLTARIISKAMNDIGRTKLDEIRSMAKKRLTAHEKKTHPSLYVEAMLRGWIRKKIEKEVKSQLKTFKKKKPAKVEPTQTDVESLNSNLEKFESLKIKTIRKETDQKEKSNNKERFLESLRTRPIPDWITVLNPDVFDINGKIHKQAPRYKIPVF